MAEPEKLPALSPRERRRLAEERAAKSTDLLVRIPPIDPRKSDRYECRVNGKKITVLEMPPIRWFQGGVDNYDRGPNNWGIRPPVHECVYTFFVGDEEKEEKVTAESIDDFLKKSSEEQQLIENILTMPIEGKDKESLAAALHIFKPSYFRGAFDRFRGGYDPEFYYTTLLDGLLPEYQKATNKKYFLLRLFRWLKEFHTTKWGDTTHPIDEDVSKFLPEWFKSNRGLFSGGGRENQVFEAGYRALRYWPDKYGVYTVKDTTQIESSIIPPDAPVPKSMRYTDAPNTIYIKYNIARGEWEWWPASERYRTNPGRNETTPWDVKPKRVEDVEKFAILKWNNAGFQSLTPEHTQTLWKLLSALPWDERLLWVEQNKVGPERQKSFDTGMKFLKENGFVFLSHKGIFAKRIDDTYVMAFRCFKEGGWKWGYLKYGTERYVHSEGSSVGGASSAEVGQWSSLTNFPLLVERRPNRNYDPGKPYSGPREWEIYEPSAEDSSERKAFKTVLDAFKAKVGVQ